MIGTIFLNSATLIKKWPTSAGFHVFGTAYQAARSIDYFLRTEHLDVSRTNGTTCNAAKHNNYAVTLWRAVTALLCTTERSTGRVRQAAVACL